jgi:amino acid transporter
MIIRGNVMKQVDGLKKELGLIDVFALASGAMISSGLFVLPAIIIE